MRCVQDPNVSSPTLESKPTLVGRDEIRRFVDYGAFSVSYIHFVRRFYALVSLKFHEKYTLDLQQLGPDLSIVCYCRHSNMSHLVVLVTLGALHGSVQL